LGLFGGTFDPPHIGHLIVAQEVVDTLGLERLLFIPAGEPPHKSQQTVSPASIRLEMVQAVVSGNERLGVCELELERRGPSFTVDTLRHFRDLHPRAEIFFIMGADQAAAFDTWHEPEKVMALATMVVLARGGVETLREGFVSVPVTRIDVSGTGIRSRVREGRSIRYFVPRDVEKVIEERRLYRAES
jgi:nicotinate-nucleotide adenylyltransferase